LASDIVVPARIRREDDALVITWSDPGHVGRFEARSLRLACCCAACVDEMSGRPLLDPATVPLDVSPEGVELVGAYGIRVRWSDGHSAGIYTFEKLRQDCPCPRCRG
jgi:ATP-binding protein involved in chromosome partitioning